MCLIFTNPAGSTPLSDELIRDVYSRNKDGYGVMFVENGVLYTSKATGTEEDAVAFYNKFSALNVDTVFHFRYKTHGAISDDQSHPYVITAKEDSNDAITLMHNGVLKTGNTKDISKSDTWHFINDYLRPISLTHPDVLFDDAFCDMLGELIGNNRFVLMDNTGKTKIVNEDQGIEWEGRWFSNTYAWSAVKFGAAKAPVTTTYPVGTYRGDSYYGGYNSYYDRGVFDTDGAFIGGDTSYVPPLNSSLAIGGKSVVAMTATQKAEVLHDDKHDYVLFDLIRENLTFELVRALHEKFLPIEMVNVFTQYLNDVAEEHIYSRIIEVTPKANVTIANMELEADAIITEGLGEVEIDLTNNRTYTTFGDVRDTMLKLRKMVKAKAEAYEAGKNAVTVSAKPTVTPKATKNNPRLQVI